jgi:energy-coupling factor transporter ATP-binding protein EcfA2
VAVALAEGPEILLCDEPTSLQDSAGTSWLLERLCHWWQKSGGTVLFATQRRHEALLADRLLLLGNGRIVATGPPDAVLSHPEAVRLLDDKPLVSGLNVGRDQEWQSPQGPPVARWERVGCRFPSTGDLFRNVDLVIPPGSRIGLTGANGCGKSTLLAMAVGWRPTDHGRCHLLGRPLCQRGKQDLDHGAALLAPQFPEYLFTRTRVDAEIGLDPGLAEIGAGKLLQAVGLQPEHFDRNPHELSSGQKRRLALALVIRSGRPLLMLDEPTAGLDLPGRRLVLDLLSQVPEQTAMVVASHDVAFLQACGCQIQVLTATGLQSPPGGRLEPENSTS